MTDDEIMFLQKIKLPVFMKHEAMNVFDCLLLKGVYCEHCKIETQYSVRGFFCPQCEELKPFDEFRNRAGNIVIKTHNLKLITWVDELSRHPLAYALREYEDEVVLRSNGLVNSYENNFGCKINSYNTMFEAFDAMKQKWPRRVKSYLKKLFGNRKNLNHLT